MCHRIDWRMLPEELEDLILSKLPLVDLARVSATSKIFQGAFRRKLAREQRAYCDSGVELLGHERIIIVAQLIDRFLKGERMEPYMHRWWEQDFGYCILRDGTCHKATQPYKATQRFGKPASQITHDVDSQVRFWVREAVGPSSSSLHVQVQTGVFITFESLWNSCQPKKVGSVMKCSLYGTAKGLPVVQALLSEGVVQMFHGGGHQVEVMIVQMWNDLTQAEFKAVVAPLMPLITSCTVGEGELVGVL